MKRQRVAEVMDQPVLDCAAHEHALRSLNRANAVLGVDRRLWQRVRSLGDREMSVLDLGCGGGGFLRHGRRRSDDRAALLIGVDRSPRALEFARRRGAGDVRWVSADVTRLPFADQSIDVVTCSLLLHHFDNSDAVVLLREAARVARRGIVVGELVRSRLAWGLTHLTTRVLSRSWVFHVDGPRSVRAAFRAAELRELARRAGLQPVKVERVFPFRYTIRWERPDTERVIC